MAHDTATLVVRRDVLTGVITTKEKRWMYSKAHCLVLDEKDEAEEMTEATLPAATQHSAM